MNRRFLHNLQIVDRSTGKLLHIKYKSLVVIVCTVVILLSIPACFIYLLNNGYLPK
ncbi:hypothetical protein RH915_02915 [Serpentinicella sp. ANB-PHB4]|uniref:hypothetical protein n=1 Tax=Serpentinicella sp. ANB-PHB4 TaxID=3074076 RepID=UPI00285A5B50|nr:hypothetical protein [Serpentinicella sp. ANB-PHB4]MDR5658433.1 hypothetical protein [Serpentinicella sp. ANB-PHB4]